MQESFEERLALVKSLEDLKEQARRAYGIYMANKLKARLASEEEAKSVFEAISDFNHDVWLKLNGCSFRFLKPNTTGVVFG